MDTTVVSAAEVKVGDTVLLGSMHDQPHEVVDSQQTRANNIRLVFSDNTAHVFWPLARVLVMS